MWTLAVQNSDELTYIWSFEPLEKCMTFKDIFSGLSRTLSFNFQDFPEPKWFSRTLQVLEFQEKNPGLSRRRWNPGGRQTADGTISQHHLLMPHDNTIIYSKFKCRVKIDKYVGQVPTYHVAIHSALHNSNPTLTHMTVWTENTHGRYSYPSKRSHQF